MGPREEIEKIIAKPMPGTAQVVSDVFKTAEMMGWGYGTVPQAVFKLPSGATVENTIEIPDREVWWITFQVPGGIPSSSLLFGLSREFRSPGKVETDISVSPKLMHEGWIGQPLCFHPSTPVITSRGVKPVKDVTVGDEVLTEEGFNSVTKTMSRKVSERLIKNKHLLFGRIHHVHERAPVLGLAENKVEARWRGKGMGQGRLAEVRKTRRGGKGRLPDVPEVEDED